jgi:hypothetical protein
MEIKNENSTTKLSKKHNKNHLILDLHFEKLVANSAQHDGFERLFLQKKKLLDTLDFCKENNLKKLEIIHGIGNGQLQELVIKTLEYQMDIDYQHTAILPHQSGSIMVFFK